MKRKGEHKRKLLSLWICTDVIPGPPFTERKCSPCFALQVWVEAEETDLDLDL